MMPRGFTLTNVPEEKQDSTYDFELSNGIKDVIIPASRGGSRGGSTRHGMSRLGTSHSRTHNFAPPSDRRPQTMQSAMSFTSHRPWNSMGGNDAISVASTSMSGLISSRDGNTFNPLNMSSSRRDHTEKEKCPLDVANEIENQINRLIEDTVILKKERKLTEALEKAKEGGKKEQALRKHRKAHSLPGDFESELMYATWFNLARAYEANDMLAEAMQSYSFLLKQRKHPLSGRLRINMGNIYYAQHDYSSAIKMYKMALDQIRKEEQSIVHKIRRNIGNAFFRLGKIRDAVKSYEEAMDATSDVQTGFNLLICHLALGDIDNAKKDFTILIEIPFKSELFEEEATILQVDETPASWVYPASEDNLNCELETRTKEANRFLLTAARLLASSIEVENWSSGYEWVQCVLKDRHEELAIQIELEQAIQWLKRKEFGTAVKMLKSLENNGHGIKAVSATNLSFLTFLEGDIEGASEFADVALDIDRYNAKALVNKGNCLFISGDYALAKDFYLEAIGVQADCVQSIFNLGLTNVQLGLPEEAIRAFEKMHKITPNNPAVIYQIADIYELQGKPQEAIKWFNVLAARVPSDSAILSRLGYLYSKAKDDSQGLHYQLESFRHFPVDLDVISSIGAWFVQQNMYEKSIYFFQQAALMQPKEIKWGFMVASAHRRTGAHTTAFRVYLELHNRFPDNIECLRCLISTCQAVERPYYHYQEKLDKLQDSLQ